jgi:hypothetical protein
MRKTIENPRVLARIFLGLILHEEGDIEGVIRRVKKEIEEVPLAYKKVLNLVLREASEYLL